MKQIRCGAVMEHGCADPNDLMTILRLKEKDILTTEKQLLDNAAIYIKKTAVNINAPQLVSDDYADIFYIIRYSVQNKTVVLSYYNIDNESINHSNITKLRDALIYEFHEPRKQLIVGDTLGSITPLHI
mgnify:CR=1 FL=1